MEQRQDNKPNPAAVPRQDRGNLSPTGGRPDPHKADPTGQSPSSGGAFGKEGQSNRTHGVDSTGKHIAVDDRCELDDDTPKTAFGDPHRDINQTKE
jgi:hypothetical protein